jgi:hypothetical protein
MNDVMVQAPTSSERLESELNPQPSGRRRLGIIGAVFQSAPLRSWLARHSRTHPMRYGVSCCRAIPRVRRVMSRICAAACRTLDQHGQHRFMVEREAPGVDWIVALLE